MSCEQVQLETACLGWLVFLCLRQPLQLTNDAFYVIFFGALVSLDLVVLSCGRDFCLWSESLVVGRSDFGINSASTPSTSSRELFLPNRSLDRVEGSFEGHVLTRLGRVKGSFEGHAPVHVPFFWNSNRVEGFREDHALPSYVMVPLPLYPPMLWCLYPIIWPFLSFCPTYKGRGLF